MIFPTKLKGIGFSALLTIGKKVWNWVKGEFDNVSEKISNENPITRESTVNDISRVSNILNDFKLSIDDEIKSISENIKDEIHNYADELCFLLEQQNKVFKKSNVNLARFNRQIIRLKENITGIMQDEIFKIISLDNVECKNILKMLPGTKKDQALKTLLNKAIDQGTQVVNDKITSVMLEIYDDFKFILKQNVEEKENKINSQLVLLNDVQLLYNTEVDKSQLPCSYSNLIINTCDSIINLFMR